MGTHTKCLQRDTHSFSKRANTHVTQFWSFSRLSTTVVYVFCVVSIAIWIAEENIYYLPSTEPNSALRQFPKNYDICLENIVSSFIWHTQIAELTIPIWNLFDGTVCASICPYVCGLSSFQLKQGSISQLRKWNRLEMSFDRQIFERKQQQHRHHHQQTSEIIVHCHFNILGLETWEIASKLKEHKRKNECALNISKLLGLANRIEIDRLDNWIGGCGRHSHNICYTLCPCGLF